MLVIQSVRWAQFSSTMLKILNQSYSDRNSFWLANTLSGRDEIAFEDNNLL